MKFKIVSASMCNDKTYIKFECDIPITLHMFFKVNYNPVNPAYIKNFKVTEVVALNRINVIVTAVQVGYYAMELSKTAGFDLRTIIGSDAELVADVNEIQSIIQSLSQSITVSQKHLEQYYKSKSDCEMN